MTPFKITTYITKEKMPLLATDETRVCPYDPTHEILVTRWERHLLRCRPNHPNSNIKICRFNWQHHVPMEELAFHEKECAREEMNQGKDYVICSRCKTYLPLKSNK